MFGDYGYMENGELGKPYNFRLLKRLTGYSVPYRKTIVGALVLTVLITLFDLAVPYFSKVAIDRFILSSWYPVETAAMSQSERKKFRAEYGHALIHVQDETTSFISHTDTKEIDPKDLHLYRSRGFLGTRKFYMAPAGSLDGLSSKERPAPSYRRSDGPVFVPHEWLEKQPREKILEIRSQDVNGVGVVAIVFFLFLAASFALNYAQYYLLEFTGQHIMQDIRINLFERMQTQALRFFDRHPLGRLVTRVTNDVENLNEMFKSVLMTVFKDFFLLVGILAVLLYLNWKMALVSFILLPFVFGITYLFSSMAREVFRELRATVAGINAFLQERLSGMTVIQLFAQESNQMERFSRINHDNFLAGMKQVRVFAVFMPVMELLSSVAVALVLWYGGGKVIQEQLSLGSLVAFIGYIQMFFKPVRDISEKYNIMQSAMASTERIFEFMDHREEIPEPDQPAAPRDVHGHLVCSGVTFSYEKDRPVLKDISFEIKPGETVAFVGPTGSGKTSIINLIERFYDPEAGVLFLDGVDLRRWPKSRLRKNIGLCMQDVFIFSGTVADNIALGRNEVGDEAVRLAASGSNALAFVQRLPEGFGHELGEGGATLSTGERQLLSFARALATNPKILILDEATSSVDPETERLIQGAISQMAASRTTIVVAHRLSTIRNADRILVINRGRIVEQGNHQELMALKGAYYKLNRLSNGLGL